MSNTFTFTFTEAQIQIISKALEEIPYKFAAPVIAEMNKQIQTQLSEVSNVSDSLPG